MGQIHDYFCTQGGIVGIYYHGNEQAACREADMTESKDLEITQPVKIGRLSEITGIPTSTIRYYQDRGLLPEPDRSGAGPALYGQEHLDRLLLIKKLRRKDRLSLQEVRKQIERIEYLDGVLEEARSGQRLLGSLGEIEEPMRRHFEAGPKSDRREEIIEAAISVFSHKGYYRASINDIVGRIGVGCGVVYNYFESKRDLFLAAVKKVIDQMIHDAEISIEDKPILTEDDFYQRMRTRALYFVETYTRYMNILNVTRAEAIGEELREDIRFEEIYISMMKVVIPEFEEAIAAGIIKPVDTELLTINTIGIFEMVSFRLLWDDRYDFDEVFKKEYDMIVNGLKPR
jgi:AcrR family transcriptional regulator/predicted transcriptional regulator